MDERECKVCGEPIDDLAPGIGSAHEEAAYEVELCLVDFEDENPDWVDAWGGAAR